MSCRRDCSFLSHSHFCVYFLHYLLTLFILTYITWYVQYVSYNQHHHWGLRFHFCPFFVFSVSFDLLRCRCVAFYLFSIDLFIDFYQFHTGFLHTHGTHIVPVSESSTTLAPQSAPRSNKGRRHNELSVFETTITVYSICLQSLISVASFDQFGNHLRR